MSNVHDTLHMTMNVVRLYEVFRVLHWHFVNICTAVLIIAAVLQQLGCFLLLISYSSVAPLYPCWLGLSYMLFLYVFMFLSSLPCNSNVFHRWQNKLLLLLLLLPAVTIMHQRSRPKEPLKIN